ncbi:MAG: hypothetical protein KF774_20930 [Planctomyces sp.]|nr:hypothetical protein [Planctomyces sp.]
MMRHIGCLAVLAGCFMLGGCGGNSSEVGEIKDPGAGLPEEKKIDYMEQSRGMMPKMKNAPKNSPVSGETK